MVYSWCKLKLVSSVLTVEDKFFPGLMPFCGEAAERHYKGLTIDKILGWCILGCNYTWVQKQTRKRKSRSRAQDTSARLHCMNSIMCIRTSVR
jgi:hypothetical protein